MLIRQVYFVWNFISKLVFIISLYQLGVVALKHETDTITIKSSELHVYTLKPSVFNWTVDPELRNQVQYSARIVGSPDLPPWLHFAYDGKTSVGYLYGVAPIFSDSIEIDVIFKNRKDQYEVGRLTLTYKILPRPKQPFVVEMKIDSMNAKDFCTMEGRARLIDVFSFYLDWTQEDGIPVIPTYLAPASNHGDDHFLLKPYDAEGVVIHLGSNKNFSSDVFRLQNEVAPLWKLRPCPRNLKRTSMEKYFRSEQILVDWCSFKIRFNDPNQIPFETTEESLETVGLLEPSTLFQFRSVIPEKNYGGAVIVALIPIAFGCVIGILLIGIFWSNEDESFPVNGDILFFEAAFRILKIICSFRDENPDSNCLLKDSSVGESNYLSYNPQGIDDNYFLLTGDGHRRQTFASDHFHERELSPPPPQYIGGATHFNGSPAITYAV